MTYADDDQSASTQRFQAFAQQGRKEDELPAAWEMKASRNKVWLLIAIVIAVAVVAAILGFLVAG